ncbi:MAG: Basal body P-ring protein [Planctomycetota bacterium]|jgi:hypothetical protein
MVNSRPHQNSPAESVCTRRSSGINRARVAAVICLLAAFGLCGCMSGLMSMPGAAMLAERPSKSAEKKPDPKKDAKSNRRKKEEDNDFGNRLDAPMLSDYVSVQGNSLVVLKGVGLVTGLKGTGGDPSPSGLRTQLQTEMARRGVKNANQILASRDTALVVVIAYLPAMVRKDQRFDVRVVLPPNSNAKSLKGGWLLETRLFEEHTVDEKTSLRPQEYAVAGGAILTTLGMKETGSERTAETMAGTIPGGAISKVDRDLTIMLNSDKRSARNSDRVAQAVSERFHRYNKYGQRIPCAVAKTDALIELKTHAQYVNNFPRYQQVIRNLALNESEVNRRMRIEMLARDIMEPEKSQVAALQLEAIGDDSIPFLKDALESEHFEVRFQAAQSLAYLGDASGVAVLHEAAKDQPAFRIFALVALSVIREDADAVVALRDLMNSDSLETRYGALRALKELDPQDPALNAVSFRDRFVMNVIDSTGEPMVHVARRRTPEIVIFGAEQAFRLPLVLNAGSNLRIIGERGSTDVEITRYELDSEPERHRVPNRLADIIQTCGELGAAYPDVVQMLVEADRQRNFMGEFGIDRLPQAGRMYVRGAEDESEAGENGRRIGNSRMLPQLFDELEEAEVQQNESAEKLMDLDFTKVAEAEARKSGKPRQEIRDESSDSDGSENIPDAETSANGGERRPQKKQTAVRPAGSSRNLEKPAPDRNSLDSAGDDEPESESDSTEAGDESEGESDEASAGDSEMESTSSGSGKRKPTEAGADQETELDAESEPAASEAAEAGSSPAKGAGSWFGRFRRPFGGLTEPEPE